MDFRVVRPAIANFNSNTEIFWTFFRVLDEDVEVAIFIKGTGIEQLELRSATLSTCVLSNQPLVRVLGLRVLVQVLHVAMSRSTVDVEVVLLEIFTVVTFGWDQTERALLQDGVAAVPQRQRKAQQLVLIGHSSETIFAPAVGLATRHVVS